MEKEFIREITDSSLDLREVGKPGLEEILQKDSMLRLLLLKPSLLPTYDWVTPGDAVEKLLSTHLKPYCGNSRLPAQTRTHRQQYGGYQRERGVRGGGGEHTMQYISDTL